MSSTRGRGPCPSGASRSRAAVGRTSLAGLRQECSCPLSPLVSQVVSFPSLDAGALLGRVLARFWWHTNIPRAARTLPSGWRALVGDPLLEFNEQLSYVSIC